VISGRYVNQPVIVTTKLVPAREASLVGCTITETNVLLLPAPLVILKEIS